MDTVRRVADGAVAQIDPVGFEVYADAGGQYRWRLLHRNGNILADSGGDTSPARRAPGRRHCPRGRCGRRQLRPVRDNAGETRWRLVAGNGETVADSGEGYASKSNAEDAVERVRSYAPEADALDVGAAAFEIYEDRGEGSTAGASGPATARRWRTPVRATPGAPRPAPPSTA